MTAVLALEPCCSCGRARRAPSDDGRCGPCRADGDGAVEFTGHWVRDRHGILRAAGVDVGRPVAPVFVGRPSRWGNPFGLTPGGRSLIGPDWFDARDNWDAVTADNMTTGYVSSSSPIDPQQVVDQFAILLEVRRRDEPERLAAWLAPLVGRDLACTCPLGRPCHADVLLAYANEEAA